MKAVELYLTKDTTDESLLIAKMSETQRIVQMLDKKIDAEQKLNMEWYQYFFMFQPEMPENEDDARMLYKRAAEKTERMLERFQKRLPRLPAFSEAAVERFSGRGRRRTALTRLRRGKGGGTWTTS